MFKFVVLLVVCIACASAVDPRDSAAEIRRIENLVDADDGSYRYDQETSNGIVVQETGVGGEIAMGGFAYTSPEGQKIQVGYSAGQNGFQPQGAHLPTPPPTPAYILRSLEYLRTHQKSD